VAEPALDSVCHVRLEPGPWAGVQRLVAEDSSRLCGAGDAFAGGTAVYLEYLKTLAAGIDGHYPPVVNAAIAGCAAAVRWIGFERSLRAGDFAVSALPLAVAA